ncbi:IRK-interacting protein-like [Cucurbita pepo subsp. pepo]|uniref:IRK-interacting protein-like n=1 Tax=Cucurbita pepo subsp. pepo TaxID=3664 RepID=UPI000C9D99E6|nr:IRK-interacting protein-like [Cucurbita pepo subsp. pepo]
MKNITPSSSPSPPLHHYQSSPFFSIVPNSERTEEEDEFNRATPSSCTDAGAKHHPTPLHLHSHGGDEILPKRSTKKRLESVASIGGGGSVSCSKCRPHAREKFSVVPVDYNGVAKQFFSMASPNGILKSIVSSLTGKSPKSMKEGGDWAVREEQWKIAFGEVSHKLIEATRKRDEAILEASRLKYSMAELEKKLNKLEIYCHSLKSELYKCVSNPRNPNLEVPTNSDSISDKIIENFLSSVSESRSSVRQLSRSLAMQLHHIGGKIYERIQFLLRSHEIKISLSKNSKTSLIFHLEAILNRAFFEDFESIGFQKNSPNQILNPSDRTESNIASFNRLHRLSWEEVLGKGTRHFSEDFSRFCDRKMSDIIAMLEWNRAWPEPLLQAFFMAAKSVWLVHLLANAVHPSLPIFRVDSGVRFDGVYMEDIAGEKARELAPATVRIMVAPGFYAFDGLIKCKVMCRYHTNLNN